MSARAFAVEMPHGAADVLACTRKKKIMTKQAAREASRRASRRDYKVRFYTCPTCGLYHLSSMDQATERARRRQ